jgi:L-iditol 2-dehydrogenase
MIVAKLVGIKKFELFNEKIRKLKSNEVLIKVKNSGICGSDLHYFRHGGLGSNKVTYPVSLGHETAGIIHDKNKSSKFKNYQNVTVDPLRILRCTHKNTKDIGLCGFSKNLCPHSSYLGANNSEGSFREFLIVDQEQLSIVPEEINLEFASMIEPTAIAQYAVQKANLKKNKHYKILVIGSGAIGLLTTSILSKVNLSKVTVIDKFDYRIKYAKDFFSAKNGFNINFPKERILDNLSSRFDYVFDNVFNSQTINLSLNALKLGGKLIAVGIPTEDHVKINPHKARIKEIEFVNIRRSNIDFVDTIRLIRKYNIPIEKLVTHKFKLTEIQTAFNIASQYTDLIIRGVIF